MYKPVSADMNFKQREKEVKDFWEQNHVFEKSMDDRDRSNSFTFYDGPPTANGKPHIGHVLTRAIKDIIPRYHAMKGQFVPRKAGWDTHGLPVELEVEKELGMNGKEQIEAYGIAPFIEKCKESVWKYKGMWEDFSRDVGFWADMEHPYVTYDNNYIESEWWSLKKIWDRGLLYKGFKIVPYCPRCGTPLASHEVAQGYRDVKERSAVAKFKLRDEDAFILAWTTTPWTLPSNVALCVNADFDYIKADYKGEKYYIAKALADRVLTDGYETLSECKGSELVGREYVPLFDFVKPQKKCWYVVADPYVSLDEGTGIVHTAPAFGEDDARVGRANDLPLIQLVDSKGEMTAETAWPGVFCKDADKLVLDDLRGRGLLFSAPVFEHSYPFCWRCGTPLIYYARESWYIKTTAVRDDLIRNNNTVNWIPESIGKGRFGDWLEGVVDWAISRNRYWGTPLPIWECECGHRHAIGSIAELKEMSPNCPDNIELHRPYIDAVTITCPECGRQMHRVSEVIDCWYDSGSMPFAQHHYPFENKELFESQFPADFISEAVDQTRGWFYSLLAISTLVFNKAPYRNVLVMGLVQDENGQKMSKSKGNAVDPFEALDKYGADAIRWYFYSNSAPWLPSRFSDKAVVEGQRKFMSTFWNSYAFYVLYADIDEFNPTQYRLEDCALTAMDRWLLSRVNSLIKEVDDDLAAYRITETSRALQDFTDELSNWYVRRGRERYWVQGMTEDKKAAYMALWYALTTLTKLAAPMVPFMTESIYQNLVVTCDKTAPESVHLCDFPVADETLIDEKLEADMAEAQRAVSLGRAARAAAAVKNRQPLSKMYIAAKKPLAPEYQQIIRDELNVKELVFEEGLDEFVDFNFKPQLKLLGAKYGRQLGEVRAALSALDGRAAKRSLDTDGHITLQLSDGPHDLTEEELLVESKQREGYYALSDGGFTVVLDTELTPELIEEGNVKELISKIQQMRKDAGFVVTDRIDVYMQGSDKLRGIMERNAAAIKKVVLGREFRFEAPKGYTAQWDVNGENATFGVEKL